MLLFFLCFKLDFRDLGFNIFKKYMALKNAVLVLFKILILFFSITHCHLIFGAMLGKYKLH